MSTLINRILGNLATRMMFIIYLSITFITLFFIVFAYYNELALQEERQYDKLKAVVSGVSSGIDGDAHQALFENYKQGDRSVLQDSVYQELSTQLREVVAENGLSPMYTLIFDQESNAFLYGVRSDDYLDFKNPYVESPKELKENMETGGTLPMYMSENGTWLSAFHPIRNTQDEVVGLVEADIEFDEFKSLVNARYFKEVMIALGVILGIALLLIPYARKVLLKDEKQKELVLNQKLMIESKNRDIMGSIRYALKIQKAMLPNQTIFQDNELESFILYQPKDVVAGDFYWAEKHGDELFFAVADCTGHGVPGAIMSILCFNALNRVVEIMGERDTGKILDKTRDIIVQRLEQGEGAAMSDGMDISICRVNLKTRELQYTGANNPMYVHCSDRKCIDIHNADKQPVGKYIHQKPFQTETFQLKKDDVIYLFTDGFADQFGGERGKKLKYKVFRDLLHQNATLPLKEQKADLHKFLRDWMRSYEQVDDICVIGVKF